MKPDIEKSHAPVTTLADLDMLDGNEVIEGYLSAQKGDPEPGGNRSRSFHHGWRTRMMDWKEIETPLEHSALVHEWVEREQKRRTS